MPTVMRAISPYSLLILAGFVLHRPSAHPLLPIGLRGPMVSVCSRRGARPSQNGLSGHETAILRTCRALPACKPPTMAGAYKSAKAGAKPPLGSRLRMGPNHPLVTTPPSSVNADMVGNAARHAHVTFSSATACCCLPCPLLTVPCFAHKLAHTQAPGSWPSPAMPTQPWPPKPCKSCCGCRCRWLRESVGSHPITDVGNALTAVATIRLRAHKRPFQIILPMFPPFSRKAAARDQVEVDAVRKWGTPF